MLTQLLSNILIGPLLLLLLIYLPAIIYLLVRNQQEINSNIRGVEVVIKKSYWDFSNRILICLYAFFMPIFIHLQWKLVFFEKGSITPFVFGLFCSVSAYYVLFYFDPQVNIISRLRKYTGVSVLGEFTNGFDYKQIDSFRERMLTSLNHEKRPLIFACTSLGHGEGKSIVAASLAKSFSRLHSKVLLLEIDPWCDLPNRFVPSSQRNNMPGISDYILNQCELENTIYSPMEESFSVIPRGNKVDAPYEMLNSPRLLDAVMDNLSQFSVIVIDAPTISQFPEINRFLLNHGVLIVSVSHQSKWKSIKKINEFIKRFSLKNKIGMILTRNN